MEHYEVILVNPRFFALYKTRFPPFAALFLSYGLKKAGFSVKIFDAQIEADEKLLKLVRDNKPLMVGFSVMTGPTITYCLNMCKKIKEIAPEIMIVWGGPHPTLLPEDTLKSKLVDMLIISEGEQTIVELIQALKEKSDLSKIKGIGYKEGGNAIFTEPREFIKNWDENIGMDWSSVNVKDYINKQGKYTQIPLITSRGCPFRCRFCWNLKANNRKWRAWSADKVIQEIEKLIPYGIDYITFEDDNFGVDIGRAEKVVSFLKKHNIIWSFEGFRVGIKLTTEMMKMLKGNGCHHLCFGAECGTQKMLDYIKKDITIEQLMDSARVTGIHKVGAKYSWIVGFPTETQEDRLKLMELIDTITKLNPYCSHYIGIFSPYPGSELYQETIEAGWCPPSSIKEWATFREEANLPYCRNMWLLRSISLTCFFKFAMDSPIRPFSKSKLIYKIPSQILKFTSNLRWKHRFFRFPIEFFIMTKLKRIYDFISSSDDNKF